MVPISTPTRRAAAAQCGRTAVVWGATQALPGAVIRRAARRGDLGARLASDRSLRPDPFPVYEQLRARGRLVRGRVAWGSVDHAVCDEVLRSPAFGVATAATLLPRPLQRLVERCTDEESRGPVDAPSLLAVDPPLHTRYRRLVSRSFTARAVGAHTERIEKTAHELLDSLGGAEEFDLVGRYAALLPVTVIADILAVPNELREQFLDWGNAAATTLDPGLSWRQFRAADRALRELRAWFDQHVEMLRSDPGQDVVSSLVTLEGAEELTPLEISAIALLLLGAGFETTVNLIGNAVAQLFAHPEQRELVADDPDLWGNVVEETLRYDSPVQVTGRLVREEVEIAGRTLPEGVVVLTLLGGANRDPEVFTDPQRFDVARDNAHAHLAFSAGAHYCLGAGLARLEAAIALRTLFERYPNLSPAGPPVRRMLRVLRGYESMPVRT